MSKLTILLGLSVILGGQAVAQDSFDREFSKFEKDFDRLNGWKAETPASKKLKRPPATSNSPTESAASSRGAVATPLNDDASRPPVQTSEPHPAEEDDTAAKPEKISGLPKGAKVEKLARSDRLGYQISDPVMRKKVQDLYRRRDIVVQQYVLPTN